MRPRNIMAAAGLAGGAGEIAPALPARAPVPAAGFPIAGATSFVRRNIYVAMHNNPSYIDFRNRRALAPLVWWSQGSLPGASGMSARRGPAKGA
jgi:hypothetical protein